MSSAEKLPDDKAPAPDEATKKRVAAGLRELGEYAGPRNVTVILESHDHFTSSATLKDVMHAADSPHAACSGTRITPSPPPTKTRNTRSNNSANGFATPISKIQ